VKKKTNDVFICPNSSDVNYNTMIRRINPNDLDLLIKNIQLKGYDVWLVGLKKDIEKYGFYENCKWINSYEIVDNKTKKEIDLKFFINKVANCNQAITVATSFEHICGMLNVKTFVLHRLFNSQQPIVNTSDDYHNFFSNKKWYENITKINSNELLNIIN
jgi:pyruvate/2-oxoglutarate/acetoin dehydrogenase E1 component